MAALLVGVVNIFCGHLKPDGLSLNTESTRQITLLYNTDVLSIINLD